MHRPLLVDLTVEEGTRLKVIYGSADGFHAVDLDSASVYDIYMPKHVKYIRLFSLSFSLIGKLCSDTGTDFTSLHCSLAKLKRNATASLLR